MRNRYGIEICRCCASCKYREVKNEGRMCSKAKAEVESWHLCRQWDVHPKLQNAGEGNGKVKSLVYLNYFRERYLQQIDEFVAGKILPTQRLSREEIRKEFSELYGSIYINI